MGDPKTPRQVERKDYFYCEECKLYWPKKSAKTSAGFFSDEPKSRCPEGHAVTLEETPSA